MYTLLVSPRAEKDLRAIWRYSINTWGEEQAEKYLNAIEQAFMQLLNFPESGQQRPNVLPDILAVVYAMPVGKHLIFYCIAENIVKIIGVPHQQMDVVKHLRESK